MGPFQLAAALKVWARCQTPGGDGLDASCLGADFVDKLANRTRRERREIDVCLAALHPAPVTLPRGPSRSALALLEPRGSRAARTALAHCALSERGKAFAAFADLGARK